MADAVRGHDRQARRFRSVGMEVTCPRHGVVEAAVDEHTGVGGPPCPDCGSACTVFAPMLALARACVQAAPRLGAETVLRLLRDRSDGAYGALATGDGLRPRARNAPTAPAPPAAEAPSTARD